MKQANEIHLENLLLTQTYAKQFWEQISQNLSKDDRKERFQECTSQLLTLIADNQVETRDIQSLIQQLDQQSIDLVYKNHPSSIKPTDLETIQTDNPFHERYDEDFHHRSFSKTLIYETTLRQNRIDNIPADINQSLDACTIKLSILSNDLSMNDPEISLVEFRDLLNDIEFICYDIEQLKHSDDDRERELLQSINQRWEDLLKQANEKYHYMENQLEQMKIQAKSFEECSMELNSIDQQIQQCTIHLNLTRLIERLEQVESKLTEQFSDHSNGKHFF